MRAKETVHIIHSIGGYGAKKTVDDSPSAILTNKNGSYLLLKDSVGSRYGGFFQYEPENQKMFRIIEHIEIIGASKLLQIENNFHSIKRKRKGGHQEEFFLPSLKDALVLLLDSPSEIALFLDVKQSYDNRVWGREYQMWEEEGATIIEFTKRKDGREDSSHGEIEYRKYVAIAGAVGAEKKMEWVRREYEDDSQRNSPPFERYVLKAVQLKGEKFVFSVSSSKEGALSEAKELQKNLKRVIEKEKNNSSKLLDLPSSKKILKSDLSPDVKMGFLCALNSLDRLVVHTGKKGVFAGLPWFFQFWARDTFISIEGLRKIHKEMAEQIIDDSLDSVESDGRMRIRPEEMMKSADAFGWLALRMKGKKNDAAIKNAITRGIEGLLRDHTREGLDINEGKETWMDTEFERDSREGARIEIQALRLAILKKSAEITKNAKYRLREEGLRKKVREKFLINGLLGDGSEDPSIRPNMFIAAYVYPELLSRKEWEVCIQNSIKPLWLKWGGLSTIEKSHQYFHLDHTGENSASYHRGDSWFWVNNLSAMIMLKISREKFQGYIQKILSASTSEILWMGSIGSHAELSGAKELKSAGCLSQAWSNAMFVELVMELAK